MADWQYLLNGTREEAADGEAGLTRVPIGGGVALAEFVTREGSWKPDERPSRARYLGSDYDFLPIPESEAEQLMAHWVEIGRLERMPDPASSFTEEERATLVSAEQRAREIWRGVDAPPGVESISLFDD